MFSCYRLRRANDHSISELPLLPLADDWAREMQSQLVSVARVLLLAPHSLLVLLPKPPIKGRRSRAEQLELMARWPNPAAKVGRCWLAGWLSIRDTFGAVLAAGQAAFVGGADLIY